MDRNMIVRLGIDASDFQKKMAQAGASAESTGRRIKKSMSMDGLGSEVAKIMGWSGAATGVTDINAGNVDLARNQLQMLQSYRDQLAGAGFDDYQFGLVSERVRALEYDLNAYTDNLIRTTSAETNAAAGAGQLGQAAQSAGADVAAGSEQINQSSRSSESFVSKIARAIRSVGSSGRQMSPVSGVLRQIGDSAGSSFMNISRMVRSIRNTAVASFAFRIAGAAVGRLRSIVSSYISENATLQAQVNSLKTSMGQALAPAINIVTNAMSTLMPYIVGVSNAFGQLMAALFGEGWTTAANNAKNTASATSSAAKAQKEMNRQLLSFDQITRMESQTDTSADGGGGSGVTPTTTIESKTPAWMERFKASFSELFNSSEFQSANVGGKIGQILQTGLDWLGQEGVDFDWRGVGTKLRGNFDSFMGSGWVDSLFHTIGIGLGGFTDFVIGIMGPQWEELKTAYENGGVIGAVAYVTGLFVTFKSELVSWTFKDILSPTFSGLAEYFRENGNEGVAGFFQGISDAMNAVGEWIEENFVDPLVNETKRLLGIHSPSTVFAEIGENSMAGLIEGFSNKFSDVMDKLYELKDKVFSIADNIKSAFSFNWQLPSLKLPHLQVNWDPVDNVLANFFGVTAFPRLSVQWFAKGGILDGAQIFGSMGSTLLGGGEQGREAVLPLDTNTGWMDVLANRIAQSLSVDAGGDVNATINLTLDGEVLTTYVMKGLRRRSRAGTSSI